MLEQYHIGALWRARLNTYPHFGLPPSLNDLLPGGHPPTSLADWPRSGDGQRGNEAPNYRWCCCRGRCRGRCCCHCGKRHERGNRHDVLREIGRKAEQQQSVGFTSCPKFIVDYVNLAYYTSAYICVCIIGIEKKKQNPSDVGMYMTRIHAKYTYK